ncbi:family 20 glycosylhydrolase [Labedaea rhizosphaerae]|uniref:Hexosaminidase n=1 Tax=Labedaea rhizosphaerae TaxID=598644 RepID=A0A4R6SIB6_LABRH|nr:family 20 glycosylhydrolase [Labedaea rhizosphaerae]TDQ01575.1 hexosaminidase [Labedaea rhizosphaerae]
MRLRACLSVAAMVLAPLAVLTPHAGADPVNAAPATVPALQQWAGGTGEYHFSATTRVVTDPRDGQALANASAVLTDDLAALTGNRVKHRLGATASVQAGDIFLTRHGADPALGTEGYTLSITDRITITATTDAGAFYGTRTVLQLLHQATSIPRGTARDWPVKAERGLMIDDGRKFFTAAWLRDHVKELAYLKLNYLHLHLSDNLGFRIESDKHPEYVSPQHLTKQEVRDLIALAARYHVTVVPEFDAPGHMDTVLAQHPDLKLVSASGTVNNGFIDLSKPGAYTLLKDIYDEYLPLFPGPYFHIGADEYVTNYAAYPQLLDYARAHYGPNATAKDTFYGFVNWANGIVRAAGKTTRMWNDGIKAGDGTLAPDRNIVVEFWYNYSLSPQALIDRGYRIANDSWDPTYYVLGGGRINVTWGYETWQRDLFQGNQTITDAGANLGSVIHVWCDNPNAQTQEQVAAGIRDPLRMLTQQVWGSPKPVATYAEFSGLIGRVGHNPAWPVTAPAGDLAYNRPVTASSIETADFPAWNATDGDPATRWSSGYTDTEWLTVDLGRTEHISRVVLRWEAAYGTAYRIETSADGVTWTPIYQTSTSDGGTDDLTGLDGTGRYVRMQGVDRATTWGFSLYEFEVYR